MTSGTATNGGYGGTDTLTDIEHVIGSDHADWINGSAVSNTLAGGQGDDFIFGSGAADLLFGGEGNDTIQGNLGDDSIFGGNGTDTVSYSLAASGITIDLAGGTATGDGTDSLTGIENATGSGSADTITGSNVANVLKGGAGNDRLSGAGGIDTLYGEGGADTFEFLAASAFSDVDVIKDFGTTIGNKDVIDLTDILGSVYDPLTDVITDFVE